MSAPAGKVVKVGVMGVGHLGQHHARIYAMLPETQLVGLFDTDPARAAVIAERHGCRVFTTPEALVAEVEAVSVAVPTTAHHAMGTICLAAGRHALIEKPIAVMVSEAEALVALAQAKGCVLQVGHSERFNPITLAVQGRIDRPGFIEAHRLAPFNERGTDVDVVLDLMIHDVDLALAMTKSTVETVHAAGTAVLSPRVDIANARLQFANGCVANLTASRVSAQRLRRCRVFQRDGYVAIDFQSRHATVTRRVPGEGGRTTLDLEQLTGSDEEPLKLQLASFIHAIRTGAPPVVSGQAGLAALSVAHRIRDAIDVYWAGLERAGLAAAR